MSGRRVSQNKFFFLWNGKIDIWITSCEPKNTSSLSSSRSLIERQQSFQESGKRIGIRIFVTSNSSSRRNWKFLQLDCLCSLIEAFSKFLFSWNMISDMDMMFAQKVSVLHSIHQICAILIQIKFLEWKIYEKKHKWVYWSWVQRDSILLIFTAAQKQPVTYFTISHIA